MAVFLGGRQCLENSLQGLLVGPVLLNRLINGGNEEVNRVLIKFTESAKLGNTAQPQDWRSNNEP